MAIRLRKKCVSITDYPTLWGCIRATNWGIPRCRGPSISGYSHIRYQLRELERQQDSSYYERVMLGNAKLSALPREFPQDITSIFKDTYVLEMLQLPQTHSENELKGKITGRFSIRIRWPSFLSVNTYPDLS